MSTVDPKIPKFTTIVAVDRQHLEELRVVWPTWRAFKPEILTSPMAIALDHDLSAGDLDWLDHPDKSFVQLHRAWPGYSQREHMLSAFVFDLPAVVKTEYYLKLDTDCAATGPGQWILPEWFTGIGLGVDPDRRPVFISNKWGYTKPSDAIQRLDDWADSLILGNESHRFASHPRLNLPFDPESPRIVHPRIISWCFFGNTDWTNVMAKVVLRGRLPVPSQDTTLWYLGTRLGYPFRRVRMARYGWCHVSRIDKLRWVVRDVLSAHFGCERARELLGAT